MRIDAYTHFFPKKFFDAMQVADAKYKDMGKRVRSIPALLETTSLAARKTRATASRPPGTRAVVQSTSPPCTETTSGAPNPARSTASPAGTA